jgi:hypothetical protein
MTNLELKRIWTRIRPSLRHAVICWRRSDIENESFLAVGGAFLQINR